MERRISLFHCVVIALLFFATVIFGNVSRKLDDSARHFLSPPPEHIEYFHFGFRESLADSLWLRWVQDNDTCQTYAGAAPAAPIPAQEGEFANPRHKFCDNSWSFKMLDGITKLAPRFEMAYVAGAITLSVLVEDYEGAKVIFDRGIEVFPNNWPLLYRASYHYLFDRHELTRAAELMLRAQKAGAPEWLVLSAARLYSRSGKIELGISTLEEFRKSVIDPKALADVDSRILALKKQLNQ